MTLEVSVRTNPFRGNSINRILGKRGEIVLEFCDVALSGFGKISISVQISEDSFTQLACEMTNANTKAAMKAFGGALQLGSEGHSPP